MRIDEGSKIVYVYSGGGIYCETCGWSSDDIELHIYPEKIELSTRYGCYSGNYTENVEEALEEIDHILGFTETDREEVLEIKEALKEVQEGEFWK